MAETAVRARSGPLAIPARRRAAAFPPRQAEVVNRVDEEIRAEMIECQACPPLPPIHTPPPASPSGVAPLATNALLAAVCCGLLGSRPLTGAAAPPRQRPRRRPSPSPLDTQPWASYMPLRRRRLPARARRSSGAGPPSRSTSSTPSRSTRNARSRAIRVRPPSSSSPPPPPLLSSPPPPSSHAARREPRQQEGGAQRGAGGRRRAAAELGGGAEQGGAAAAGAGGAHLEIAGDCGRSREVAPTRRRSLRCPSAAPRLHLCDSTSRGRCSARRRRCCPRSTRS